MNKKNIFHKSIICAMMLAMICGVMLQESKGQYDHSKQRGFVRIFDGQTFTGWEGNMDLFRIEDGVIVAGSMEEPIARNEFLTSTSCYRNFELKLKVKLEGDPDTANAGVQFRSRRLPNSHEIIGYQADMGEEFWGNLYDESRRRVTLAFADREQLDKVLKIDGWNEYVIRCEGNHIQLWLNGCQTVDYIETDDSIVQSGVIALQIHAGPPTQAKYKDIYIRELD